MVNNKEKNEELKSIPLKGILQLDIERKVSIVNDCRALFQAWRYFRKMRFDAVQSITPKAGLICAIAGKMAAVRHRTHIFTGQVWATRKGVARRVLKLMDKIIARLDNHILVDGKSQRSFLIKEGIIKEGQATVFCNGSIAGVNAERFSPSLTERKRVREECGIHENKLTYVFLGRMNHDKGIGELLEAFDNLAAEYGDVFLLLAGSDEDGYLEKLSLYQHIEVGKNFHFYGYTKEASSVLNAGDVFVLPTWREGFGTSVLEAACVGLPCICSDAYGVMDAYIDGVTGLRCHVGDPESLFSCMKVLHDDPALRKRMGISARERAINDFDVKPISLNWLRFYEGLLG